MIRRLLTFIMGAAFGAILAAGGSAVIAASGTPAGSTAVIVDEEAGIVRVLVGGEEAGRFTRDGLHVEGAVSATQGVAANVAEPAGKTSAGDGP